MQIIEYITGLYTMLNRFFCMGAGTSRYCCAWCGLLGFDDTYSKGMIVGVIQATEVNYYYI